MLLVETTPTAHGIEMRSAERIDRLIRKAMHSRGCLGSYFVSFVLYIPVASTPHQLVYSWVSAMGDVCSVDGMRKARNQLLLQDSEDGTVMHMGSFDLIQLRGPQNLPTEAEFFVWLPADIKNRDLVAHTLIDCVDKLVDAAFPGVVLFA